MGIQELISNNGHLIFPETQKGTYILILHLQAPLPLTIGKLGIFDFAAGWYAYVGSAFGPGGLRGRLKHHLSPISKPHWHIDYLRQAAQIQEVWYIAAEVVYEHDWADALRSMAGARVPVTRFGASDCRCQSHLIYFDARPDVEQFQKHSKVAVYCWITHSDQK